MPLDKCCYVVVKWKQWKRAALRQPSKTIQHGGQNMTRAYTENRKLNNQKWDAANLDRLSVAFPKGTKDRIKAAAAATGESMNQYIYSAVCDRLGKEQPEAAPEE